MYLAIDTATDNLSVALLEEVELMGELNWRTHQNHTAELIPTILHLLGRAKSNLDAVEGIAVAKGPGGFTGLRVGITTAKGLAMSLRVPLVGVGTLEAWAYPYVGLDLPVCPIMEVGRGEVAAAMFRRSNDSMRHMVEEHITTTDKLSPGIHEPTIFCGNLSDATKERLKESLTSNALFAGTQKASSRAYYVGRLGLIKVERHELDDPSTLQPIYLRRPSITQPRKVAKTG